MKRFSIFSLALSLLIGAHHTALAVWPDERSAVILQGGETATQIQEAYTKAISAVASDLGFGGGSQKALQKYEATLHHAARPGAEEERAACCRAVAGALLRPDTSASAKHWLLKLTEFAGKAEMVPAEAKLLDDPEPLVREAARCALQHNPAPEGALALRSALAAATQPPWQAALALALGTRKDAASVPILGKLLEQKNEAVAAAALFALGNIASAEAARILSAGQKTVPETLRLAAAESYLKCAEQMLKGAKNREAAAIYRDFDQPSQPRSTRLAALEGLLRCAGSDDASRVLAMLAGPNPDAHMIAAGFIPELSGVGLKKLAAGMGSLPPPTQAMVLGALADRGEKSALPEAVAAAKNTDETIRLAGLNALGRLGNASTVPMLVESMQAGGTAAAAARESLLRLDGTGVNEAIVAAMQTDKSVGPRTELISTIESRGATLAVPALVRELPAADPGVRRAAMRALGKLAAGSELPVMLQALLKATPGGESEDAERAIAAVCARNPNPDQQAQAVLAAYGRATPAGQAALLPLLGRLGGKPSFEVVRSALAGNDPTLQKAGEAALMNWPDTDDAVEGELLSLAQRSQKPNERAAALRAYIRVISMPSGLPEKARLAKFQKAMDLAARDEERTFLLEKVSEVRHIETLRFVLPYLDQPALAARAGNTVCDLAKERGLRDRNKAEFEQALNKVIGQCKDQAVVDRAKRRLQEK
jgi:HEAT repeat protein